MLPAALRKIRATRLAALVLVTLVAACGGSEVRDTKSGADQLYQRARKAMNSSNYKNAIAYYEALTARFPFANQTKQAQLDLIYAYYMNREPEPAVDAATNFERENPTHPRVDYALYMRGLANFEGQRTWFHRVLRMDPAERPPDKSRESFSAFAQLVQRFPQSPYSADARQRMIFLRNFLANHENRVARYYYERGAWMASLNRAKYAMETYDGAPAVPQSLRIMIDCYNRLGMAELAQSTRAVLAQSYPEAAAAQMAEEKRPWYRWFW
jgi:outer membrane protein assembly factor BamD